MGWRDVAEQTEGSRGRWVVEQNCMQYQSTEEEQQLCVCVSRRSWWHPRGLYVSRWASTRNHHLAKSSFWHAGCHIHVCLFQGSVTREAGLISAETHTRCLSGHSSLELFMTCLCVTTLRLLVTWLVFHDNHFLVPSLLTSILRVGCWIIPDNKNWWSDMCFWRIILLHEFKWGLGAIKLQNDKKVPCGKSYERFVWWTYRNSRHYSLQSLISFFLAHSWEK